MACPYAYDSELAARIGAANQNRKNKALNMVPYKCNRCHKWHVKNRG